MNGEWANRIGITFDLFAGLLLAPELIGLQRIRKFEEYLERLSQSTMLRADNFVGGFRHFLFSVAGPSTPEGCYSAVIGVPICILCFAVPGFVFGRYDLGIALLLAYVVGSVLFFFVSFVLFLGIEVPTIIFLMLLGGFASLYLVITIALLLLFEAFSGLMSLVKKPARFIVRKLEGEDKLQAILVSVGIILFILGQILQLVSTF